MPPRSPDKRLRLAILVSTLLWNAPAPAFPPAHDKKIPAIRWSEQAPGCTFSQETDGKLRYGLWAGDIGIVVAVDAQELEKVHRRHEPFFAILLEVRYRGQQALNVKADKISLEFVQHFQVEPTTLDPDDFARKIQDDADAMNNQTAREVKKNPEKKDEKESYLRAYLKDSAELQEFVGKSSLRSTQLDPANPQTSGWVFFSTRSKWIGSWKKQEKLILRVPLNGQVFEFPFTLPPKPGQAVLRTR